MPNLLKILVVAAIEDLYSKIEPLLLRRSLEVSRATNGRSALTLLATLRYDVVLAIDPLHDFDAADWVRQLRSSEFPSKQTPILLLASDRRVEDLSSVGPDVEVIAASRPKTELQETVSRLLGVAMRSATRLLVSLEVHLDMDKRLIACQTLNVSKTGMLVRTSTRLPLGTRLAVSFALPNDPSPIEANAEVVRNADAGLEGTHGLGMQFFDVRTEDSERLEAFVSGQLTESAT